MDNLITALSIIWSWEIYLFTLIALLAYTPITIFRLQGDMTAVKFFGYPVLGVLLQTIATIFLFISVYVYFYQDLNFLETIVESFLITFGKNGLSSALFLFIVTFILLIADGSNNFRFIIGIFVFNTILGINDSFIPLIPDFETFMLILVLAFFNSYLTPMLAFALFFFPFYKISGNKENIFSSAPSPSVLELWLPYALYEFLGLIPPLIYLNWMMNL